MGKFSQQKMLFELIFIFNLKRVFAIRRDKNLKRIEED